MRMILIDNRGGSVDRLSTVTGSICSGVKDVQDGEEVGWHGPRSEVRLRPHPALYGSRERTDDLNDVLVYFDLGEAMKPVPLILST